MLTRAGGYLRITKLARLESATVRGWRGLNLYNMDYHIDAKNKVLGRVATEIAVILQGKKSRATREPRERRQGVR